MRKVFSLLAAALAATTITLHAHAADTIEYNSAPSDPWSYGSGNDYTPSNTAVLTTDGDREMYLRVHKRSVVAPASDSSGVYSFGLDPGGLYNFDWGFDTNIPGYTYSPDAATLVITNLGTGAMSIFGGDYAADNALVGGSVQNSVQFGWLDSSNLDFGSFGDIGFDPGIDNTYRVDLRTWSLDGDGATRELSVFAKFGAGAGSVAAVPEPATWALMILGFGMVGGVMRTSKRSRSQLAAA